jgi:hypothetical protein
MKHPLNLLLRAPKRWRVGAATIALVCLFSCSKQESNSDATTAAPNLSSTPPPAGREPIQLTPEQIERTAWDIFEGLRSQVLQEDPDVMAYVEEFWIDGSTIHFKLLCHNGDDAGWHEYGEVDEDPPYAEELERQAQEALANETEEERTAREAEEARQEEYYAEEAAKEQEYRERYGGGPEYEPEWVYVPEVDTFSYNGSFSAFLEEGTPESTVKKVRIVFTAMLDHDNVIEGENRYSEQIDESEIAWAKRSFNVGDVIVELGTPLIVDKIKLYIKAKITDLTPEDIAGMTKDELSFLRNEIFARHGHTFKTPKMMDYFGSKRWYHPIDDDAQPLLNKFEKKNVEFLKKKEG